MGGAARRPPPSSPYAPNSFACSTDVNFTYVECQTNSQDSGVFVQSCVLTKARSYYVRVSAANTVGYGPPLLFTGGTASPVAVRVVDLPSPPRSINSIIHSGEYELTRTDFKYVKPYYERFEVQIGPMQAIDF